MWSGDWACTQPWSAAPPPQQLDPENTGFIGADTFTGLVHSNELPLDPAKLDMLVALAQSNEQGQVCYQELVDLVSATVGWAAGVGTQALENTVPCSGGCGQAAPPPLPFPMGRAMRQGRASDPLRNWVGHMGRQTGSGRGDGGPCLGNPHLQISSKRSSSFKRAIANGQRALSQDELLNEPGLGIYKRFVRYVAYEILPREVDRHWYFYRHRSCPPPVFMASVTLAQVCPVACTPGSRLHPWRAWP